MKPYNPDQAIISASLDELWSIAKWTGERELAHPDQTIVLVGGWAVHSYNDYWGSVDIDLVTSSDVKSSLMYYLRQNRGFKHYGEEGDRSVSKMVGDDEIIIDFLSNDPDSRFKGRTETFGFDTLEGMTEAGEIGGALKFEIPKRSLLLLYKLKASWDRTYSLEHEKLRDPDYVRAKMIKDGSDIIALIDPAYGGHELDINYLGRQLGKLDFLKEHFQSIPENIESIRKYGHLGPATVRSICDELLLRI